MSHETCECIKYCADAIGAVLLILGLAFLAAKHFD